MPACQRVHMLRGVGGRTLFAGRGPVVLQRKHHKLVYCREAHQVGGVVSCGAEDEGGFLSEPGCVSLGP